MYHNVLNTVNNKVTQERTFSYFLQTARIFPTNFIVPFKYQYICQKLFFVLIKSKTGKVSLHYDKIQ